MIFVTGAIFCRGSRNSKNEMPVTEVKLSPYWIDTYPVTNARFVRFIESEGYHDAAYWTTMGWDFVQSHHIVKPLYWDDVVWNQPDQPVTGVSWWEALAFAKFEGKTLPTEAQWEYAAGKGEAIYPWGSASPIEKFANYAPGCEPSELRRRSTSVYAHPAGVSQIGCHDMAGNLNEWCIDNFSLSYLWDFYRENPVHLNAEDGPHIVKGGSGVAR
ncbi:SUMF1/EgtB/PvdO family nonheme iron enzyme [Caballeronia glebae]